MSHSVDPRIGTELAGYRIEALLGRGGMSVVYRARDLALERRVALKLIAPELAEDERFRERFLKESKIAASIDHTNVIPIYEAGETDGLLYIAMRYVEGTDLKNLLEREGPLEPARTLTILGQVASALDAARFAHGLVHRDVKPGNILLASEPGAEPGSSAEHVYLSDFGLSKHTADQRTLTEAGQFLGTIDYVAPEQIEEGPIDGRVDVYSLGCVLYECLTGEVPYRRESKMALLYAHLQEPPPSAAALRPDLPAGIDGVIGKALAKSPDDRYPTCRELIVAARAELEAIGEQHPALVGPAPARPLLLRFGVLPVLAAALALAAAAAVPAVLLTGGGGAGTASAADLLVRIDPQTSRVVARIGVGESPSAIAIGKKVVWVGSQREGTVSMIGAGTNRVVGTFGSGGRPQDIGATDEPDTAWVASDAGIAAVRPSERLSFAPKFAASFTCCVAAEQGSVWVGSNGTILRIDPATGKVLRTFRGLVAVRDFGGRLVFGGGSLWSTNDTDAVLRLDPATGRVIATIKTGALTYPSLSFAEGSLWLASHDPGRVLRIDPGTNRVARTIGLGQVGAQGSGHFDSAWLAVEGRSLWVVDHFAGAVSRIDQTSGKILETIRVPGFPNEIEVGHGSVWVAVARYP